MCQTEPTHLILDENLSVYLSQNKGYFQAKVDIIIAIDQEIKLLYFNQIGECWGKANDRTLKAWLEQTMDVSMSLEL